MDVKIEKVLETIFLQEWNTTAIILETRIVVKLFLEKYMDKQECFEYISDNYNGWVQTSELYRTAKSAGQSIGIKTDPLSVYEELYESLEIYATLKFKDDFKFK